MPFGPERGALQRGEAVTLADGTTRRARAGARRGPARPDDRDRRRHGADASVLEASVGADLLVHEATFLEDERERAAETAHSTARRRGQLARAAGVRLLALTHLSTRYFGPDAAREARAVFPETVVPRDFDIIDVPFRGAGRAAA